MRMTSRRRRSDENRASSFSASSRSPARQAVLGHRAAAGLDDLASALEVPDFALEFRRRLLFPGRLGDAVAQAGKLVVETADRLVIGAPERVDDHGVRNERFVLMGRQGIEVELVSHVFEEVFLRPAREHGACGLGHRLVRIGGDEGHLTAAVEQAADLAHPEAVRQGHRLLGQPHGGAGDRCGPVNGNAHRAEVLDRPVFAAEVLVSGQAGDAAPRQPAEQARAPALAVEDQGERWLAGHRGGQVRCLGADDPEIL